MTEKAILFDSTLCIACRGCQSACKQWNGLGYDETRNRGSYENPPDLTSDTWVKIKFKELENHNSIDWVFTRQSCMHCTDAACVDVCPSEALKHHPDGFVIYDKDRCTGCAYCVEACPFDVPRVSDSKFLGIRKMDKCVFCRDRVDSNYKPACVKTCPTEALVYGDRNEIVLKGNNRVNQIRSGYPDARLYGATELGGLHVMYILSHKPEIHGLPASPRISSTIDIHRVVRWAGVGAVAAGAILLGINFLVARARQISETKGESESDEIERYRKRTVWFHWIYTLSFLLLFFSGIFLFVPGWGIVAQDSYLRATHRVAALVFAVGPVIYFLANPKMSLQFIKTSLSWSKYDLLSLRALAGYYFGGPPENVPAQGFINSGQKAWQLTVIVAHIVFLATGAGMAMRSAGDISADQFGWMVIIHDLAFIASGMMLLIHVYLGSLHPRTRGVLKTMLSGKMLAGYAREHHSKWYDEVTDTQDA